MPLNCSIVLERKAQEYILNNIANATSLNRKQLLDKIRSFSYNIDKPLTLRNFTEENNIPLAAIYKKGCWKRLCAEAGVIPDFSSDNEIELARAVSKKWLLCNSISYLQFIARLADKKFAVNIETLNENEQIMCLMLHYDIWQNPKGFENLSMSIKSIGRYEILVTEIKEVLEILIDKIDFIEKEIQLDYALPLKIHSRYTRDQICCAFGENTFDAKSSSREGVINIKNRNTELLFITLEKSEKEYSPTTLYDDYAVSDTLFHWQSQNSARPEKGAGLSYVQQKDTNKKILLFVREKNNDEFGNTMGYVFLGDANYVNHYSEKPMSITWELNEPLPSYMWKDSAKMAAS